ncbi:MAG: epoxyqueuosine reductase [Deltaproteobacteria bacterium]|nr:epoxyqueuosine reductase [Candidatus Zymogenaceae bacterium]
MTESPERLIGYIIQEYVTNRKRNEGTHTDWEAPLIAFASASDPAFDRLRFAVSMTHTTPKKLFPESKTVVVYFLPFVREIVESNDSVGAASEQWALAYVETNRLIIDMNRHLVDELKEFGIGALSLPPTHNFDPETLTSDWSHKHAAFIAGLGTFGLHKMIITEKGSAGRLGSLLIDAEIPPSPKPFFEYCLYKYNKSCRKCVAKCTFGALKEDSFDRFACYDVLKENDERYGHLGPSDVCGKCVTMVPCSFENPVK